MPDIAWQLTATENVSSAVQRIGQSLAGLDSSNAKAFGGMVQSLSNAQNAATRAATALQRLETAEVQTATATQRLATAQAQTEAAQSRAASAALRLQQAQEQAARGFADVGRAAQQHGPGVAGFFQNALSAATGFLAANVFARLTSGITDFAGGIVQAAASMEQTRAGFTSLLGSAQQADALIAQLQKEANVSPFELSSFRQGAQLLLGMGVAADQVVPRLHEISNAVAATGRGTDAFDRITLALSQIQAKGKVSAQEINQLAENGVAGWDILSRALGKTRAEVIALSEDGKISADTFFQAFAQFANSPQIAQAAERQSHTFTGLISTLHDVGAAAATAFGEPALQAAEPTIERIVTALKDPGVLTTLGQWGQAAGTFVAGLLQAGETAVTVGGQVLQALKPVTDLIGNLLGVQGGPTITPPDFAPAAASAGQWGAQVQQGADSAKSAKDQIADLERQTRELSRATAEANVGYDHRKQSLQDQLTLLDRQYQAENKAADISQLQQKIAKDRALAVDQYSSQGQAAAARLVDEEARLAQLQREQGHDAAKNAIEDRIKAVDREKQANSEASAARTRQLQEQMDALRANAAAVTALTNAIKPPAPDKSKNRNVNDAFGDEQTSSKAQGTIGLLQQLADALTGNKGVKAAIDSVGIAWGQLGDAFKASNPELAQLKTSIDDIAHALGLDAGFAAEAVIAQAAFKQFAETAAALVPQNLAVVGAGLKELNDQLNITAKGLTLFLDKVQGKDDRTIAADLQAFAAALQKADTDRQRGVAGFVQQVNAGNQRIGDITQQNIQDLVNGLIESGKQGTVSSGGATSNAPDFGPRTTGNGPDFGPGVTTTRSRNAALAQQHTIRMEFDERGFKGFVDATTDRRMQEALR